MTTKTEKGGRFSRKPVKACLISFVLLLPALFASKAMAEDNNFIIPDCSAAIADNDGLKSSLRDALINGAKAASTVAHGELTKAEPPDVRVDYCIKDGILKNYFESIVTIPASSSSDEKTTAKNYVEGILALSCNDPNLCITVDGVLDVSNFSTDAIEKTCNSTANTVLEKQEKIVAGQETAKTISDGAAAAIKAK